MARLKSHGRELLRMECETDETAPSAHTAEHKMKLRMKNPCAVLTLPDGSEVDVERIGKGRFTTAWRNCSDVYLQVHEDDSSKDILSSLSANRHTPKCERLEWQHGNKPYRWYKMPLYYPLTATSKTAWKQFKLLKSIQEECWRATMSQNGYRASADQDATRMRQFVQDAVNNSDLPGELKEAIEEIIDETYNYGSYSIEFAKRNLAIDGEGNLILLDPVFDLEWIRGKQRRRI